VAEAEHVVGGAARIGVVLLDSKAALVVQQAIEDMRRLARGRGDNLADRAKTQWVWARRGARSERRGIWAVSALLAA